MAGTLVPNTATQLNESFKYLYSDKLQYLQPKSVRAINDIKPRKGKLGREFLQPVVLKNEQGFTYAGSGAQFTFNDTIPGIIKEAKVNGTQLHGWCGIDYETAAKGANSRTAFVDTVGHVLESLWISANRRRECRMWYGNVGLGIVSSVSTATITITTASYAPSIWVGSEGAKVSFVNGTTGVRDLGTTQYSTTINSIDMSAKTITLASPYATIAAGDYIVWETEASGTTSTLAWNEGVGIHYILGIPTTLFGITSASYSLWQANTYDVGSTVLSVEAIEEMTANSVAKGLEGDANLYINPKTMSKLITDLGGLRRFMKEDGKTYRIGAADIEIECQGILVRLVACPYIWEGYGYFFSPDIFEIIQAYALSSKIPGRGDDLFYLEPGKSCYSMQLYNHEALFCNSPCLGTRLSGIVN